MEKEISETETSHTQSIADEKGIYATWDMDAAFKEDGLIAMMPSWLKNMSPRYAQMLGTCTDRIQIRGFLENLKHAKPKDDLIERIIDRMSDKRTREDMRKQIHLRGTMGRTIDRSSFNAEELLDREIALNLIGPSIEALLYEHLDDTADLSKNRRLTVGNWKGIIPPSSGKHVVLPQGYVLKENMGNAIPHQKEIWDLIQHNKNGMTDVDTTVFLDASQYLDSKIKIGLAQLWAIAHMKTNGICFNVVPDFGRDDPEGIGSFLQEMGAHQTRSNNDIEFVRKRMEEKGNPSSIRRSVLTLQHSSDEFHNQLCEILGSFLTNGDRNGKKRDIDRFVNRRMRDGLLRMNFPILIQKTIKGSDASFDLKHTSTSVAVAQPKQLVALPPILTELTPTEILSVVESVYGRTEGGLRYTEVKSIVEDELGIEYGIFKIWAEQVNAGEIQKAIDSIEVLSKGGQITSKRIPHATLHYIVKWIEMQFGQSITRSEGMHRLSAYGLSELQYRSGDGKILPKGKTIGPRKKAQTVKLTPIVPKEEHAPVPTREPESDTLDAPTPVQPEEFSPITFRKRLLESIIGSKNPNDWIVARGELLEWVIHGSPKASTENG